jgi:hypothetical protein
MNFTQAEAEIRSFFKTAWAGQTEIAWPDVEFDRPNDQTWVRFNCAENAGFQASMGSIGSNRFRHLGVVTIQVFQPEGQGSKDARAKANNALGAFMGAETTNDIHFFDVAANQIGNDGSGYYQINVTASFRYDEIT